MWKGVGHLIPQGSGERNSFGKDFYEAGKQWTPELCRYDSDGDGKSNGEELGDPNCVWEEGEVPEHVTGITHPGVCTPYGEGNCTGKDTFVDCSLETFGESCGIIKEQGITTMDLKFKQVNVPSTETNYFCQYFELPDGEDFHIVANEGVIDNHQVVHHMIIYGCPDSFRLDSGDDYPHLCSMKGDSNSCSTPISLWSVGLTGVCFGRDMGFRIGATGYKRVRLEIHYNNPLLEQQHKDASGFRLYLQKAKDGVQDLTTFSLGQMLLEIPPGKERVEMTGSCPAECSRSVIRAPMNIVMVFNHMHYLGRSQKTEILRGGKVIKVLANEEHYSYDEPKAHRETEHFQVLPGDELRTTCVYSSMSKKNYVYYGDATDDEMCFAFLTVYPASAVPMIKWCPMRGPLSTCELFLRKPKYGCDWRKFTDLSDEEMQRLYIQLEEHCSLDGTCRPDCLAVIKDIEDHPCLGKEMKPFIEDRIRRESNGDRFLARLNSCWGVDPTTTDPGDIASLPVPMMTTIFTALATAVAAQCLVVL